MEAVHKFGNSLNRPMHTTVGYVGVVHMQLIDSPEVAEILHRADGRPPSLDDVQRTLIEVAGRLNIAINVHMHEPEKTWPVRLLLTKHIPQGSSMMVNNNVTLDEKGLVCHTMIGADCFDTAFTQVSKLICWILWINLASR